MTEIRHTQRTNTTEQPAPIGQTGAAGKAKELTGMERAVNRELSIAGAEALAQLATSLTATPAKLLAEGSETRSALRQEGVAVFQSLASEFLTAPPSGVIGDAFALPQNLGPSVDVARAADMALGTAITKEVAGTAAAATESVLTAQVQNEAIVATDLSAIHDGRFSVEIKKYDSLINALPAPTTPGAVLLQSTVVQTALRTIAPALQQQAGSTRSRVGADQVSSASNRIITEAKKSSFALTSDADIESLVYLLFMQIKRDANTDTRELIVESRKTLDEKKELREKKGFLRELKAEILKKVDEEWSVASKSGATAMTKEEYREWRKVDFRETGDPSKPYEASLCDSAFSLPEEAPQQGGASTRMGSGKVGAIATNKVVQAPLNHPAPSTPSNTLSGATNINPGGGIVIEAGDPNASKALALQYGISEADMKLLESAGLEAQINSGKTFEQFMAIVGIKKLPTTEKFKQIDANLRALEGWKVKTQLPSKYGMDVKDLTRMRDAFMKESTLPHDYEMAQFEKYLAANGFKKAGPGVDNAATFKAWAQAHPLAKTNSNIGEKVSAAAAVNAVDSLKEQSKNPQLGASVNKVADLLTEKDSAPTGPKPTESKPEAAPQPVEASDNTSPSNEPVADAPKTNDEPGQFGQAGFRQLSLSDLDGQVKNIEDKQDSLNEFGEIQQMRLQRMHDLDTQAMTALSNFLKKASEAASSITQNLK